MRKSTPKRSCSILPKWKKGVKTAAHMYHPSHREYPTPPRELNYHVQNLARPTPRDIEMRHPCTRDVNAMFWKKSWYSSSSLGTCIVNLIVTMIFRTVWQVQSWNTPYIQTNIRHLIPHPIHRSPHTSHLQVVHFEWVIYGENRPW